MSNNVSNNAEFRAGARAYEVGMARTDCPYPESTPPGQRWIGGWRAARAVHSAKLASGEEKSTGPKFVLSGVRRTMRSIRARMAQEAAERPAEEIPGRYVEVVVETPPAAPERPVRRRRAKAPDIEIDDLPNQNQRDWTGPMNARAARTASRIAAAARAEDPDMPVASPTVMAARNQIVQPDNPWIDNFGDMPPGVDYNTQVEVLRRNGSRSHGRAAEYVWGLSSSSSLPRDVLVWRFYMDPIPATMSGGGPWIPNIGVPPALDLGTVVEYRTRNGEFGLAPAGHLNWASLGSSTIEEWRCFPSNPE